MRSVIRRVDWVLILSAITLVLLGLTAMKSFDNGSAESGGSNYYFYRQIFWLVLGLVGFFTTLNISWDFLKTNSIILLFFYFFVILFLVFLLFSGTVIKGAASWYKIYSVAIQPVEFMKIIFSTLLKIIKRVPRAMEFFKINQPLWDFITL